MLDENYYNQLLDKFSVSNENDNITSITAKMILQNNFAEDSSFYDNNNIGFSFPKGYDITKIINFLYEELSKKIFINHADLKSYSIGDILKRKGQRGNNNYIIDRIQGLDYYLKLGNDDSNTIITSSFGNLKKNYISIRQNGQNNTLLKYQKYFKSINPFGFLPAHFSKKLVLIAGQIMWRNLKNKDCIPSIYLPNSREEQKLIYSIPALEDCISYITPNYAVCYEEILQKGIKIDTIIVCDTDLASITQVIIDQSRYKFKLIVISKEYTLSDGVLFWNWKKEEVKMLDTLSN